MLSENPDLSVVIACFNEAPHLVENVREVERSLAPCRWSWELILVDDHSTDGTADLVRKLAAERQNCRCVIHESNVGRGGSVSEGLRLARGRVAGFLDIDLEVHSRYIPSMVSAILDRGFDVATAHRVYRISLTPSGVLRWSLSVGYRQVARVALGSRFKDTETGFKFFRREAIVPVLDRCVDRRWFWDTEVMLESAHAGLAVTEIPALFVRQSGRGSSLRVVPDTLAYLAAIRRYRRRRAGG